MITETKEIPAVPDDQDYQESFDSSADADVFSAVLDSNRVLQRNSVSDMDSFMRYLFNVYSDPDTGVQEVASLEDFPGTEPEGQHNVRIERQGEKCVVYWKNDPENPVDWNHIALLI